MVYYHYTLLNTLGKETSTFQKDEGPNKELVSTINRPRVDRGWSVMTHID